MLKLHVGALLPAHRFILWLWHSCARVTVRTGRTAFGSMLVFIF
jgi:hypothetical protein